jgi:hypothetical protein
MFLKTPLKFFASTSTQLGKPFCSASSSALLMRSWARDFSRTDTVSVARSRYEGMFTGLPFTSIALCDTSWRASARVVAKPIR